MLRTILTVATCLLLVALGKAQQKIGSNVFTIDRASMLEIESDSSGVLLPRLTTAQRDAQIGWDESHIIYNTTDNCLQIYTGTQWDCIVQGVVIDSSIYRHNGALSQNRVVTLNGFQLTFDGSSDVVITSDGFLGIGDPTPEAKLDVEGGTVRFSDYGSGINIGSESYLLGVDSEGDVIEVTPAIDTFFIQDDQIKLSLQGDRVPFLGIDLAGIRDTLNIYTDNGTLLNNRIINSGGNFLRYQGTDEGALIEFQNDGDIRMFGPFPVFQLTDTSGAELRITTNINSGFISTVGDQNLILRQNNVPALGVLANDRIRLYNYGSGLRNGVLINLLGVESDGDLIEIDPDDIGSDDQVLDVSTFTLSGLNLSLEDDGVPTIDIPIISTTVGNDIVFDTDGLYLDESDDQIIDSLAVVGQELQIRIEGDANGLQTVDLSSIGSDDQTIDSLALVNDSLQIRIEDDVLRAIDLDTLRRGSIDLHDDVDVTSTTPTAGDILAFDGVNFVPEPTNNGYTIFEIFAEESAQLDNNQFEWAFGNGDNTPSGHGIVIPLDCELWAMTLDHEGGDESTVRIVVNTAEQPGYEVVISGEENDHSIFPVPLKISAGDVLNFRTISASPIGTSGRVSAWFRIRATPASNSLLEDLMDVSASTIVDGQILVFDGATFVPGDDSDDQIIDSLGLVGNELQIGLENDVNGLQTLDLSPILGSSDNIYNTDGTLEGDRTVELDRNTLTFEGADNSVTLHDDGFSLVDIAYTAPIDPSVDKNWISGRTADGGAPVWGVDILDNDFWSEGGIVLGASGVVDGTFTGGNFIVEPNGDVGIGTTTPNARLEVTGGSVIFDEYGIGTFNDTDTGSVKYILAVDSTGAVVELKTAQNTRWFYAPSVSVDASAEVMDATIDLYQEYASQFSAPSVRSPGAPDALPLYQAGDLYYYVTTFDDQVIDNISINAAGVMEYDIIDVPFDNYTIINIVFVIK